MSQTDSKSYNPIKAGIAYTIGNMLVKGIPFITLPIFTRILTTADFGLYNTYLSYENIISILLGLGLYGTIRIARYQYEDSFEEYISTLYSFQSIFCLILYPIVFIIFKVMNPDTWFDDRLLIILLCNCFCTIIYNVASAKYAILGDVKNNLILSFILTIFNICLSLLLCLTVFSTERYFGRILGTFLGAAIITILILFSQLKANNKLLDIKKLKFALKMGIPLIPHMLSLTILSQCDKIMIQSIVGNSEAGIYSFAVNIISILTVLVTSIDNAWAPWFYGKLRNREYKEVSKINSYMVLAFGIMTCLFMLVSPDIIKIMSDSSYWNSIYSLIPLTLSTMFNFAYLIPVNLEYFHKKTIYVSISTLITAVLNIILNFFFISFMGYIGAAYATCISKLVLFVMHCLVINKLQKERVANIKMIIVSFILTIIVGVFVLNYVDNYLFRYIVFILLFIISCLFIKKFDLLPKRRNIQ